MIGHQHQWFGCVSYAQHGDDMVVLNVFKRVGIERGTYLDIGAHHPFELSNTALLYARGWRGVNVEANPDLIPEFLAARPHDRNVHAAVVGSGYGKDEITLWRVNRTSGINSTLAENLRGHGATSKVAVPALTVAQIVCRDCDDKWPDFISIDAEGQDMDILRDIPPAASAVILIEARSQHTDFTQDIRDWAGVNGYYVHSWCGHNMLLVQRAWREGLC